MATPHISAKENEIAKLVIMPGDPLRAKFIAETYLEDIVQVNSVRNMFAYTGTYQGKKVTVMGSGMGMPSIGIYSYELFKFYGVEAIVRVGSAGSYTKDLNVYDVVLATSAYSESSYAKVASNYDEEVLYPSLELNGFLKEIAQNLDITLHESRIHSSDVFYREDNAVSYEVVRDEKECGCVEMESFALFNNARVLGKKAACLVTISDSFITHEVTSAEERQTAFTKMMEVALGLVHKL